MQGVSGQAVDRHLLGLRLIAQEAGMEIPNFFKDEAYSRSMYYRLSTSQVSRVTDIHKNDVAESEWLASNPWHLINIKILEQESWFGIKPGDETVQSTLEFCVPQ